MRELRATHERWCFTRAMLRYDDYRCFYRRVQRCRRARHVMASSAPQSDAAHFLRGAISCGAPCASVVYADVRGCRQHARVRMMPRACVSDDATRAVAIV